MFETLALGVFLVGRKGAKSRFEWKVGLISVGQAATCEANDIVFEIEPGDETAEPDESPSSLVSRLEHSYRLRPDFAVELELPADLSHGEAQRLADFIRTLPFGAWMAAHKRQWRDYRTAMGGRPVKDFLDSLTDEELAEVVAAMKEVAQVGPMAARHLRGELYEVRAFSESRDFRVLFSSEGRFGQVLLSLVAFTKQSQKTPKREIEVAERRLSDWRARGRARKQ